MATPDASTSLGAAIGLQGVPKDYAAQYTGLAMRQGESKRKQEREARKSNEKSYKMFDLKPGAMLKGREEDTKHRLGSFYDNMSQVAQAKEDPKTNPGVQQSHAENLMHLDAVTKEREAFYKDLELAKSNPAKYKINPEVFNTYAGGKSYGDEVPYYQSGSLLLVNGDPQKRIAELGAAVKPKVTQKDVMGPNGQILQTDISGIDPADNQFWAEKFYQGAVDGTDIDGQIGLQNIQKNYATPGQPLYDPKFNLLSPDEQNQVVKKKFIEDSIRGFEAVQGQSEKHNISRAPVTNINVNTGSVSGADNQQIGREEFNIPAYTTNSKGETVPDKNRNFTVPAQNPGYVISLKKGELILPVGPGILDLSTLQEPQNGRGNLEITGGYSATVPVYKNGTKAVAENNKRSDVGGLPIPADLLKDAEDKGLVEYKLKFIGNGTGASGKSHQIMFDINQPITDAAILKESAKDQAKVAVGIQGAKGFTEKQNKNNVPTIKTKSEYDALPKGTKYRDSKGNLATKK